jgi:hypothetical protein
MPPIPHCLVVSEVAPPTNNKNRRLAPTKKEKTMQNQKTITNRILPPGGIACGVVSLALILGGPLSATARDDSPTGADGIKPPVLQTHPYGQTYGQWSAAWWQWTLAFPSNADPANNTAPPTSGQSGKVWFLATVHGSVTVHGSATITRSMTVPYGKALFFPILTVYVDNTGCPYNDPLLNADQLAAQAADIWTAVSETSCTIDGVPVEGLGDPQTSLYRVQSPAFSYTVASHNNLLASVFGEPCIPDGTVVTPAVSDGVFLMVAPLSVGQHTIHFIGVVGPVASPFFFKDITYNLTISPGNSDENQD